MLIAGGIGITAVLPFIAHHANVSLHWSVKACSQALVDEFGMALERVADKHVRVGARLDVEELLGREESEGWERIGVVVCGPGGLCDEVRVVVGRKGKAGKCKWELDVEAFSW